MYNPVYGSASKNEKGNVIFLHIMGPLKDIFLILFWPFVLNANSVLGHKSFFVHSRVNFYLLFLVTTVADVFSVRPLYSEVTTTHPGLPTKHSSEVRLHFYTCVPEFLAQHAGETKETQDACLQVSSLASEFIATRWCSMDISKTQQ